MLVLCVGMYRACSTWQYGVVGELIERHRDGLRLGFVDGGRFGSEVGPTLEPGRWAVLKAHDAHRKFVERLDRGQARAIYSHRDLRDVAFSWMHKTGQTFDEMIAEGFLGQCLRNDWFWRDRAGMLIQSYETLIAEPARGVAEIAEHLGIVLAPDEDREIAESLSFEANRKRTKVLSERLQSQGVKLSSKDQGKFDSQTLLHWNHIRDGRAGYWHELASPDQQVTLARICGPWLVANGYEPATYPAEAEPAAPPEDASRSSNIESAILAGMFEGRRGTYVEVAIGRSAPLVGTRPMYLKGWRGVDIREDASDRAITPGDRPEDLHLWVARPVDEKSPSADGNALDPPEAEPAATMAGLIERYGLFPPDLFSIAAEGDEARVLREVPLATWRPKVFVIELDRPGGDAGRIASWESILLDQGYRFAAWDGVNRAYVRGDLADALRYFEGGTGQLDAEATEASNRGESGRGLVESERRLFEEALTSMNDYKVEIADLKARFGHELDDRHRHYLAWLDEREGWRAEHEALRAKHHGVFCAHQALQAEHEELRAKHHGVFTEYQALLTDRPGLLTEIQSLRDALADLSRKAEHLEGDRNALFEEVNSLHGVIGRLQGEIQSRDAEIVRTRARLGPYLKIDRLGVVPAIQRQVHAHKAHKRA